MQLRVCLIDSLSLLRSHMDSLGDYPVVQRSTMPREAPQCRLDRAAVAQATPRRIAEKFRIEIKATRTSRKILHIRRQTLLDS